MAFEQANISSSSCFSGCFSPSIGKFLTWLSLYQSLAFDFRDPRRNAKRMTMYAQWLVAAITAILIHIGCKRQIKEPTPVRNRSSVSPFQAYPFQSFLWKSETRMGACLGLLRRRQHLEPHHFRDASPSPGSPPSSPAPPTPPPEDSVDWETESLAVQLRSLLFVPMTFVPLPTIDEEDEISMSSDESLDDSSDGITVDTGPCECAGPSEYVAGVDTLSQLSWTSYGTLWLRQRPFAVFVNPVRVCSGRSVHLRDDRDWTSVDSRRRLIRPAGGDPEIDRPQKFFLTVCVSLNELGPSEPHWKLFVKRPCGSSNEKQGGKLLLSWHHWAPLVRPAQRTG